MSIYRRKFKAKNSKGETVTKLSSTFTAEFQHGNKPYRKSGFPDRDTAKLWIKAKTVELVRGEIGIVKANLGAIVSTLIKEYVDNLKSLGRDAMYCYTTEKRLRKLSEAIAWQVVGDISIESFDRWRKSSPTWRKKPIKAKTINQYIDSITQFCDWLVSGKRILPANPLAQIVKSSAVNNDRYRRAGTIDEFNKLLAHAPEHRAIFYQFLLYTPLRMKTIRELRWRDVHLDDQRPWIEIAAESSKSRRRERSAIRYDVAHLLRKIKAGRRESDLVFDPVPCLGTLRKDLAAAGVAFSDSEGLRRLDFHAFRKSLVRLMKRAGVSIDIASEALHHRDRRTTQKFYDDDMVDAPLTEALEQLPAVQKVMKLAK